MKDFFLSLIIIICVIYTLFLFKYDAREKLNELQKLEKMISEEEKKIKLLKIDFEHLSRPEVISKMLYLAPNLQPIMPSQVIVIEEPK